MSTFITHRVRSVLQQAYHVAISGVAGSRPLSVQLDEVLSLLRPATLTLGMHPHTPDHPTLAQQLLPLINKARVHTLSLQGKCPAHSVAQALHAMPNTIRSLQMCLIKINKNLDVDLPPLPNLVDFTLGFAKKGGWKQLEYLAPYLESTQAIHVQSMTDDRPGLKLLRLYGAKVATLSVRTLSSEIRDLVPNATSMTFHLALGDHAFVNNWACLPTCVENVTCRVNGLEDVTFGDLHSFSSVLDLPRIRSINFARGNHAPSALLANFKEESSTGQLRAFASFCIACVDRGIAILVEGHYANLDEGIARMMAGIRNGTRSESMFAIASARLL